jgi:hypothetical protein
MARDSAVELSYPEENSLTGPGANETFPLGAASRTNWSLTKTVCASNVVRRNYNTMKKRRRQEFTTDGMQRINLIADVIDREGKS